MSNATTNTTDLDTKARAALRAAMDQTSAQWASVLTQSGFTPTESHAFASGGMVQAIFATTIGNAEEQADGVAKFLARAGFHSIVVLEPSDEDPVWMVSGKAG